MRLVLCLTCIACVVHGERNLRPNGAATVQALVGHSAPGAHEWRSSAHGPRNIGDSEDDEDYVVRNLKKGKRGKKETKAPKGKKNKRKHGDDNSDDNSGVATVAPDEIVDGKEETTSPSKAPLPMSSAPITPTPAPVSPTSAPSPSATTPFVESPVLMPVTPDTDGPTRDIYQVVSCGDAEEIVSVEVNYLYTITVAPSFDVEYAVDAIATIEEENLKLVVDTLLPCGSERARRRRQVETQLLSASALPKDEASGLCGDGCTVVNGGVTVFVADKGDSDYTLLQCEVLATVRDSMILLESDLEGIDQIDLLKDDFSCDGLVDRAIPGAFNANQENQGASSSRTSVAAIAGIVVGVALIALLTFLLVRRRNRSDESTCSMFGFAKDDDNDLSSIMTPETGESPNKSSPERISPTGSLDSPDRAVEQGPLTPQSDSSQIGSANQINSSPTAVGPAGYAASVLGFDTYETDQRIVGRNSDGDFLFDNADAPAENSETPKVIMADSDCRTKEVPMAAWPDHRPESGRSLILSSIPEIGDDESVETAVIGNISRVD